MTKISIIVPSYNETAEVKRDAIDEMYAYLKSVDFNYEVLIVDDESTNNTRDIVKEYIKNKKGFKLIENNHGGKAITVMTGMLMASGDIVLFTDMDQATPLDQLNKFLPKFKEGFDIVIGTRKGRKGAPLMRKLAALGFSILRGVILGLPFKDTQCGFKAFSKESVDKIFPRLLKKWQGMRAQRVAVNAGFDVETLFFAKKHNLKVAEVEVEWRHVENLKQVQLINDALEAIKDMIRIRLNDFSGEYNVK